MDNYTFNRCDECKRLTDDELMKVTIFESQRSVMGIVHVKKESFICGTCVEEARTPDEDSAGYWTNNGYTWTSADGTKVDVQPFSTKRFPRPSDRGEDDA